jgi:acetylornithine deacetylase/succinyl-diaminopimelate desuccinylase-like protein
MTDAINRYQRWFSQHRNAIQRDFFHLLSLPTVSALKENLNELKRCASYLESELHENGFKVETIATAYAPIIIAKRHKDPRYPTVLFYHHYDVQPVDPLPLWKTPPFEPHEINGAVYARGAQDNKGQLSYTLTALKALHHLDPDLPVNITVLIEGEEEIGSQSLKKALEKPMDTLRADYLYIVDSSINALDKPVIGIGARGILTYELFVRTQAHDQHSGEHGGIAYSATKAIVELLATCFHQDGTVAVDGFYEGMQRHHLDPMMFDTDFSIEEYRREFGSKVLSIHPKATPRESNWIYPALEINGIHGGYTGEGFKTVLPCEASAKLSIRTVDHQDKEMITERLRQHLQRHAKKGLEVDLKVLSLGDPAFSSPDGQGVKVAQQAYQEVFKVPCKLSLCGGSIPITARLAQVAGCEAVLIGTGLMSDNIHAPNENFQNASYEKGFLTIVNILAILSKR